MITLRRSNERGLTELGWLHSRHTFSFGEYYDPQHRGFSALRVINDDVVEPGMGFGTHGHQNAEIFSYVLSGALQHRDSLGNGSVIRAGHLQYMSAGDGVEHSEFNASKTEPVHFLQVWLRANVMGGDPRYAEKRVEQTAADAFTLLFSGTGRDGSVAIRQDADVWLGRLNTGRTWELKLGSRRGWLHLIKGELAIGTAGLLLQPGDGAAIEGEPRLPLRAQADVECLWFDLP